MNELDKQPERAANRLLISRRSLVIGGAMLAAAGTAATRMPVPDKKPIPKKIFDALIPNTAGDWKFETASGVVLPPNDALSDRLYDNLTTRIYQNSAGSSVMLLLAYNNRQDGVLQIHRPEICYPAGGYALSPTVPVNINFGQDITLPCNKFSATSNSRNEQVLYWTRVGNAFPRRWSEQRIAVLRANLLGIIPDGLLGRVSLVGENMDDAIPVLEDFMKAFSAAADERLQTLLYGKPV
jgi:EpsI family protein